MAIGDGVRAGQRVHGSTGPGAVFKLVSPDQALLLLDTGRYETIDRSVIAAPRDAPAPLDNFSPEQQAKAMKLAGLLGSQLDPVHRSRKVISALSADYGKSVATIYRALERYDLQGVATALLPAKNPGPAGQRRLSPKVEAIYDDVVENYHFKRGAEPSNRETYDELETRCRSQGLKPPHLNTILLRLDKLDHRLVTKRRYGRKKLQEQGPVAGEYPFGDRPLGAIQMDHWLYDVECVGALTREPCGRPWLTLAIDVCTRLPYGFYLSFDPPNSNSAGLCIVQGALPKAEFLNAMSIDMNWPIYGIPKMIHVDNAREFDSQMMETAAKQHGIELKFRPVKTPQYGPHIERLFGSFAKKVKRLPGATGSKPDERTQPRTPGLTIDELELHLLQLFKEYINKPHRGLDGDTPLNRWNEYFYPREGRARPEPRAVTNPWALRLDFMPRFLVTVQRQGIRLNGISYRASELDRFIKPVGREKSQQLVARRDPRDIRYIHVNIPQKGYVRATIVGKSVGPMDIWTFREQRQRLISKRSPADYEAVFSAQQEQRRIIAEAVATTDEKTARRGGKKSGVSKSANKQVEQERRSSHMLSKEPFKAPDQVPANDLVGQASKDNSAVTSKPPRRAIWSIRNATDEQLDDDLDI